MSFREEDRQADKSGCGENGLHGDLEQSFHTTLGFSQGLFSTNQLLQWPLCIFVLLTSNNFHFIIIDKLTFSERNVRYVVLKNLMVTNVVTSLFVVVVCK